MRRPLREFIARMPKLMREPIQHERRFHQALLLIQILGHE